jgi:hypothetical protein
MLFICCVTRACTPHCFMRVKTSSGACGDLHAPASHPSPLFTNLTPLLCILIPAHVRCIHPPPTPALLPRPCTGLHMPQPQSLLATHPPHPPALPALLPARSLAWCATLTTSTGSPPAPQVALGLELPPTWA